MSDREIIQDFIQSRGWKIIDPLLKDALHALVMKRKQSDDPNFIMACVKQEYGISLIYDIIDEYLEDSFNK